MSPVDIKAGTDAVVRTDPAGGLEWAKARAWLYDMFPGRVADVEVALRAAYAAGREDECVRAHRERMADMLDNARDDR